MIRNQFRHSIYQEFPSILPRRKSEECGKLQNLDWMKILRYIEILKFLLFGFFSRPPLLTIYVIITRIIRLLIRFNYQIIIRIRFEKGKERNDRRWEITKSPPPCFRGKATHASKRSKRFFCPRRVKIRWILAPLCPGRLSLPVLNPLPLPARNDPNGMNTFYERTLHRLQPEEEEITTVSTDPFKQSHVCRISITLGKGEKRRRKEKEEIGYRAARDYISDFEAI